MNPSPEQFFDSVDKAILAGVSNSRVSIRFKIGESSVRKRKRILRERGLLPSNDELLATGPERCHVAER